MSNHRKGWSNCNLQPTSNKHTRQSRKSRSTWSGRFSLWKSGAKTKGREFTVTLEDIKEIYLKQNGRCFYSGKTLDLEPGRKTTISLDRLDNSRDYTKDNVVLCCSDINYMKGPLDKEEFIRLCNYVSWIHKIERYR